MNRYRQLTSGERYALSALRKKGCNQAAIARALGRHRSTISRWQPIERPVRQRVRWVCEEGSRARSKFPWPSGIRWRARQSHFLM